MGWFPKRIPPTPGQVNRVITPESIAVVDTMVKENRLVILDEIAKVLNVSHGFVHHSMYDILLWRVNKLGAKAIDSRIKTAKTLIGILLTTCWCLWRLLLLYEAETQKSSLRATCRKDYADPFLRCKEDNFWALHT